MQRIHLQFFNLHAVIESDWLELILVLQKDFWSFLLPDTPLGRGESKIDFFLKIEKIKQHPPFPKVTSSSQTQNAISYDQDGKRFSDYYGELYTIIDFKKNIASLFSIQFEKAHEVAYLLILSRIGKKLDLQGFHKLHAFAISYEDIGLVCMMPSKGGKSTLLLELLKNSKVKMLSDDIPFIDKNGNLWGFPLKLGINKIPENIAISQREENIYSMQRSHYGPKMLICTRGLGNKIEDKNIVFKKIILVNAVRFNSNESEIENELWGSSFMALLKHGIIGIGTPIIIEYFWENGVGDFFTKGKIFIKRMSAFFLLNQKSKKLRLSLGKEPGVAAEKLLHYIENLKSNGGDKF